MTRSRRAITERLLSATPLKHASVPQLPYVVPGVPAVAGVVDRLAQRFTRSRSIDELGQLYPPKPNEEHIACLLCGSERRKVRYQVRKGVAGTSSQYSVAVCDGCGLHLRCPGVRVENVAELYATDSYADFLEGSYSKRRKVVYRKTLQGLGLDKPSGERLLDLGCGTGIFMSVAHELGYDAYGLDLSPSALKVATDRFGADRVAFGSVWDASQLGPDSYDVITLWSVLAHIADPREQLSAMAELLAPGGSLVILTVNANSLQRQVYRGRWNGFTPNHLVFWDTQTLTRILTEVGFSSVKFAPSYAVPIERGTSKLSKKQQDRYRRVVDDGDCGNMLRVVATVPGS